MNLFVILGFVLVVASIMNMSYKLNAIEPPNHTRLLLAF